MDQHHSGPVNGSGLGPSMPLHHRGSMVARPWQGFSRRREQVAAIPETTPQPWMPAARRRRRLLLALVAASTALATAALLHSQSAAGHPLLQSLQTGLFALLFAWVSAGFFTAVMGFVAVLRGDRHMLSRDSALKGPLDSGARTALIMPICNEDVRTVFAGLRATCDSLAATDAARLFDIYILSDSSDPVLRAAELAAWSELRTTLGHDRVFYRWRQRRTRRKAGNVADFCRRWGRNYRYMVVLDADSVMSGDCLATLVRLMEAHPSAGILQTVPQASGHNTLHARAQQFAARVTGRLFSMGMQYWQLGEAHYWGHNAIIRVQPFMQHCALAPLPGKGGLSGDILSHDFVEAALMRRAGYHVWLVPDLAGSYEQQPPHLLAELQRDRRWCQGNLQNARLIAEPGLHAAHRVMLLTGAMAYFSAPLWLAYIGLGLLRWLPAGGEAATALPTTVLLLWAGTLAMLLLPRVLGVVAVWKKGEQRFYGGTARLALSSVLEALLSALQAPLRMVAHSMFVVGALTGWKLEWVSPPREATSVSWAEAARRFAPATLVVLAIALALAVTQPPALFWLAPVGLPLLLAIPFTVWASRDEIGARLRAQRLLLIPEESWPPAVLRRARNSVVTVPANLSWTAILADSRFCAVISAAMGERHTSQGVRGQRRRDWIAGLSGTDALVLKPGECMRFLSEPNSLRQLRAATLYAGDMPPAGSGSRAVGIR